MQNFSLTHGEQLVAEGTLVQIVALLLEQKFQLLHEKARDQFVFSLFQNVQAVKRNFSGHLTDYLRVDATHVDLDFGYLLYMLNKEVETFLDQSIDFKEVGRDQDCHCIFYVKFWTIILLNSRLFIGTVRLAFLNCQLPSTASADAVQGLVALLFLFELFHGENVVKQPFKDDCITVNRNIDLILV